MSIGSKILYAFLPFLECNSANGDMKNQQKITWNKIHNGEPLSDVQKFISMDENDAKYLLEGVRGNIVSLQDKAKVTAVAVTLAFSMVGGISSYLLNLKEKLFINGVWTVALIFFIIASCFYLITAGYYSLITLNSRPKYDFSPDDFEYLGQLPLEDKKKEEKLSMMGEHYKMTTYQNSLLNNYVDCSNNNLRNALISLGIFFSLICLSFVLVEKINEDKQTKALAEQTQMIKDIQMEIKTLKQEIEVIRGSNKNDYNELNSSIAELNVLMEEIKGEIIQNKTKQ
ncbi:hypothetical protein [Neobacillus niacini]|uniref:hypothetical protein n=1 Tax=Neobacillus niacini TaxID=86668 RepID=UPI0021CB0244|nr:hypothetical protein [Neobacillus niacini]MCM3768390.1 hypothetical protein [Neobacillus niacini]